MCSLLYGGQRCPRSRRVATVLDEMQNAILEQPPHLLLSNASSSQAKHATPPSSMHPSSMHPAVAGTRITRAEASSHLITSQTRCSNAQPASWHESDRHEPSSQLPGQHTAALQHCTGTTALHQCKVQQGHRQRSSSATVAADSHCGSASVSSTPHSASAGAAAYSITKAPQQCASAGCGSVLPA